MRIGLEIQRSGLRLPVGMVLHGKLKGRQYEVKVVDGGVRYNGKKYKTITAVCRAITGVEHSGTRVFHVRESLANLGMPTGPTPAARRRAPPPEFDIAAMKQALKQAKGAVRILDSMIKAAERARYN